VVIKIWDQRRLIVPLSYFIENSYANWTRHSSDILGTAFLYVDYTVPVEAMRAQLEKIAANSPLWDKRVCGLQVTDLKETHHGDPLPGEFKKLQRKLRPALPCPRADDCLSARQLPGCFPARASIEYPPSVGCVVIGTKRGTLCGIAANTKL
jgi:Mechanosensitive ion channel